MLRQGLPINNSTSVIQSQLAKEHTRNQDTPVGRIQYYKLWIQDELSEGTASFTMLGLYNDEQVVIKKYKVDELQPYLANEKMLKEWEILHASFPSQYIVRPVGYYQKPPLLVMEYIEHGSLETYLSNHEPLTWEQKISIVNDVALGMLKLLDIGIIHRD